MILGALLLSVQLAPPAAAQGLGLTQLQQAIGRGEAFIHTFLTRPPRPAPKPLGIESLPLPTADPQTVAWLEQRIPDFPRGAAVRVVPLDVADGAMKASVAAGRSYLDLFTDPAFRGVDVYLVRQDVLDALDGRYSTGSMPVRGTAEDGRPFQMQAFVAGAGKVSLLYDRDDFSFKVEKDRFRIRGGGRVGASILGPGDVSVTGLSAYAGIPIFCSWADFQRMTEQGPGKMRVETSCGSRDGNPLPPVTAR